MNMMLTIIAVTLSLMILPGRTSVAMANADFSNEPAGMTPVVNCNFTTITCAGQLVLSSGNPQIASDATGPVSPPSSLLNHITAPSTFQAGWVYKAFPFVDEIFMGVWWKMNEDFGSIPNQGNKLWFFKTDVSNSFFAWYAPGFPVPPATTFSWFWNTQNTQGMSNCHLDNIRQPCATGAPTQWLHPQGNAGGVSGQWVKLEAWARRSTTTTSRDGALKMWKNGALIGSWDVNTTDPVTCPTAPCGVNWGNNGFKSIDILTTWDGTLMALPSMNGKVLKHFLDHIYISTKSSSAGGDTTAPSIPSGLSVGAN